MSVQVENLEHNTVKLTIEVPAEEFAKAVRAVYNREKRNISLPGFRKGKVPQNLVEKMYGKNIFCEDAANDILPEAYAEAVEDCGLEITSRPQLSIVQLENGEPFVFAAEVAIRPDVTLGAYTGVEVTIVDTDPTEEEIEKEIDSEREKNARTISIEDRPIESGDIAVIDYEGSIDGVPFDGGSAENHSLEIGSNSFIPGFEDQLIGKNAGSQADVNVTFPEDYHAEDLAGKDALFKVTIHEIKTKVVPELDEDFVQDVSEFDTIEEYRESIAEKIRERKENAAKSAQSEEAIAKIVEAAEMDIPELMIDSQCEDMIDNFARQMQQSGFSLEQYMQMTGSTMDDMKDQVRDEAESGIRRNLVLNQISKEEGFEISDEDLDAELLKMAEMYQMELDQVKAYMGESDLAVIRDDLLQQRATAYIMEHVQYAEPAQEPESEDEAAEKEAAEDTEE